MVGVLLRSHSIREGLLVVVAIELLHEGQAMVDGNSIAVAKFLRVKNALPEAGEWTLLLGYV
jgi:ABC-type lipopolysaccharide export system ATPase subunit